VNQGPSFGRFNDWVHAMGDEFDPPRVKQSDLQTLAACLSDIHDHCDRIRVELDGLISGASDTERLQSAVAGTEVQLGLAVRNWRELEDLLRRCHIWIDDADHFFDELGRFEKD
jgi:hypothetical protein